MATKVSSYLTKLGFRQLEHVADAANYNNETGGEYIVIRENTRIYLYDATSNAPIDSISILPTSDGGASRWIAVGGGAMTQYKISYTFESYSNEIPLGMTVLSKANIFYVNIENTQILSTEFNLNDAKDTIVLSKPFEAGVRTEVVIFVGDYQPESRDYELLTNKPMINNITLVGNRSLGELGIQPAGDYATNTKVNTVESTLENKKADKATTLAGYNIGDAYTKTEVDSIKTNLTTEINKKANSDNVYTKSEIDTTVADLNQKITDKFLTTNGTKASWAMIDKTTVGLNNVDNTSDLNKPISTAVQEALDSKADRATVVGWGMPDYSAVISLGGLTKFTAPTDGIAYILNNYQQTMDVYINGIYLGYHLSNSQSTGTYVLNKGDILTTSSQINNTSGFVPFKGVTND